MSFDFTAIQVEDEQPITNAKADPSTNPAIPLVESSWAERKADAKGVERGKTLGFTVEEADAPRAISQLRAAAGYLGIGLSVQERDVMDGKKIVVGKVRVAFAAKTKRAASAK